MANIKFINGRYVIVDGNGKVKRRLSLKEAIKIKKALNSINGRPKYKGARVEQRGVKNMSPVSKLLKEKLASVKGNGTAIVTTSSGRQVISSKFGKSMRELYLEEQGYDID